MPDFDRRWLWAVAPIAALIAWFTYSEVLFWFALLASIAGGFTLLAPQAKKVKAETKP